MLSCFMLDCVATHSCTPMLSYFMLDCVATHSCTSMFSCFIFQKNKLADMAKAKRLNRNFYDIVEKAKWYVAARLRACVRSIFCQREYFSSTLIVE